jgi:hypothetical protein
MAPDNFGELSNAVLVGNTDNGRINAFEASSGAFIDQLRDANGAPVAIDGLYGLDFGNGTVSGDRNALYFSAPPDNHRHGLFGSLRVALEVPAAAPAPQSNGLREIVRSSDSHADLERLFSQGPGVADEALAQASD